MTQMERLLVLLADRSPYFGAECKIDSLPAMSVRLYLPPHDIAPIRTIISQLSREDFLDGDETRCRLTTKGWEVARSTRRTMRTGNQAFVGMWFNAVMDAVFDNGISPALRNCGYAPYRVDREGHNNKIDDQIMANIRKSRIFVGDLTGLRPNVFYEAGFALGLGIPVLLTCNEGTVGASAGSTSWFKQVADSAFDVRQYVITGWDTPADLNTKLDLRIRALGLNIDQPTTASL
ncbi:MAG TPA: hypothetical protein VK641_14835 [Terriglobales bacterium]|nr:hypothetical protein [Terriglobales bacterium]